MTINEWDTELPPTLQGEGKEKRRGKQKQKNNNITLFLFADIDQGQGSWTHWIAPRFCKVKERYSARDLKTSIHGFTIIRHTAGIIRWFSRPVLGYYRASARLKECQYTGIYFQSTFNTFSWSEANVNTFKEWRDFGKQNLQNER